jgi:hypothetical protein
MRKKRGWPGKIRRKRNIKRERPKTRTKWGKRKRKGFSKTEKEQYFAKIPTHNLKNPSNSHFEDSKGRNTRQTSLSVKQTSGSLQEKLQRVIYSFQKTN